MIGEATGGAHGAVQLVARRGQRVHAGGELGDGGIGRLGPFAVESAATADRAGAIADHTRVFAGPAQQVEHSQIGLGVGGRPERDLGAAFLDAGGHRVDLGAGRQGEPDDGAQSVRADGVVDRAEDMAAHRVQIGLQRTQQSRHPHRAVVGDLLQRAEQIQPFLA